MRQLILALFVTCLTACGSPGQKLLKLEILVGDEVVLETAFDVADSSTEAEIWDSAGEVPFSTQVNAIQPSSSDPLKAEIEGSVKIRILWTGTVESAVTLDGLLLVRSAPGADDWRLPLTEILRAKAAAGL